MDALLENALKGHNWYKTIILSLNALTTTKLIYPFSLAISPEMPRLDRLRAEVNQTLKKHMVLVLNERVQVALLVTRADACRTETLTTWSFLTYGACI